MKHISSSVELLAHRSKGMPYEPPRLSVLQYDFDAPPEARPLGEPVLSARDVLAIAYSAFAEIDESDECINKMKLEVLSAIGEGRVGLAVRRAILGAAEIDRS